VEFRADPGDVGPARIEIAVRLERVVRTDLLRGKGE
jgi:hypothetical protein